MYSASEVLVQESTYKAIVVPIYAMQNITDLCSYHIRRKDNALYKIDQ